ncbi:MAG: hypothetical protein IKA72_05030 [Clostridia bacterium]|nr:hypothetical protein [Clostridia bacterium]
MTLEEKMEIRRFQRYWKKEGRKRMFTWVHRYLRLHSELLDDSVYQQMFDYHRNTLIAYFKRDVKRKDTSDKEYGEVIDVLADIYNQNGAERANKYKSLVEELYRFFKEHPNAMRDIRI